MIAPRQAGPANGNPHLLPEPGLRIDAGGKAQCIAQGNGELVAEILRRHDVDAAGGADDFRRSILHHRSEEHTSELQSLMRISYAVFCLKKKKTTATLKTTRTARRTY